MRVAVAPNLEGAVENGLGGDGGATEGVTAEWSQGPQVEVVHSVSLCSSQVPGAGPSCSSTPAPQASSVFTALGHRRTSSGALGVTSQGEGTRTHTAGPDRKSTRLNSRHSQN